MDSLPAFLRNWYKGDFRLADAGFHNGQVEATTKTRATHWANWTAYVDPYLEGIPSTRRARCLSGFMARIQQGGYGCGRMVKGNTVSTALMAIGKEIALVCNVNPLKIGGSEKLLPQLAQVLDGWRKEDGPAMKKLPVKADVPEYLVKCGLQPGASDLDKAVGDLTIMAFYYLLRIGEYTIKSSRNDSKQTVQFRMCEVTFFKKVTHGALQQLP